MQLVDAQGGNLPLTEAEQERIARILAGVASLRRRALTRWVDQLRIEERPTREAARIAELLEECGVPGRYAAMVLSRQEPEDFAAVGRIVAAHPHAYVLGFHTMAALRAAWELAQYARETLRNGAIVTSALSCGCDLGRDLP